MQMICRVVCVVVGYASWRSARRQWWSSVQWCASAFKRGCTMESDGKAVYSMASWMAVERSMASIVVSSTLEASWAPMWGWGALQVRWAEASTACLLTTTNSNNSTNSTNSTNSLGMRKLRICENSVFL